MASTKLAFLAVAVLLLQCAVAQQAGTPAVMALTSFEDGDPTACDGQYPSNDDLVVALSTVWFKDATMCHRKIRITNSLPNGLNLVAEVVDECDTQSGCKDNMIATSKRVWKALGLDTNLGEVPVTWSIA
ncbi:hypothetical protein BDA96_01G225200 [Sorghum bicolor]|uniref:Uncharacterized protein n=2 Tax=Sorghum bicolor TaxID=4558 RepID=A0A921RZJ1_SORBI|nr:putative ripening-related protein 6 [Sorghum bicolor]KAG0549092.1 hypothetical protein BDA96_01G225200 [Sorghum bicolor]OQU91592.1 hypothetical protein SORBI_3001G211000 [Sorghum bicolor]|eukprot:XP_002467037.1 putative ripening-related protein 6 [Sorghum bicolor]